MSSSSERSSSPEDYPPGTNPSAKGSWATGKKIVRAPGINPKIFGHIPGVPVGATFEDRWDCSLAGVHGPLRGGIAGGGEVGAYSVVLSGGYEDDEDHGETILYTGQGGRGGTKLDRMQGKESWVGEQVKDQEWTRGNKALKLSCTNEKPVRVVRGHTLKSRFAPAEGYRYDGLYEVMEAWRAPGKTGFMTCRFRFSRLPDQPPLPGSQRGRSYEDPIASTSHTRVEPKRYTAPPNTQPNVVIHPKVPLKPGPASAKPPSVPVHTSTLKPGPFSASQRRPELGTAPARPSDPPKKPEVTIPKFSLTDLYGGRDPRLGPARPVVPSKRPSDPPSVKPPVDAPSSRQPPVRIRLGALPGAIAAPQKRQHDKDSEIEDGELTRSEDVKPTTAKRRRTDSPDLPQMNITLDD